MKTFLMCAAALLLGFIFRYLYCRHTITRLRRRVRALRPNGSREERKRMETTKKVIWVCLINGFAWVWCSYVLAYLDKMQIAESLSQVAVTEIIGVVLAYCIKSAVENLSKNNHWPDKHGTTETDGSTGPEPEREEPQDIGQ